MPYKTWATNDIPTASDFNNLFADPSIADVTAQETTASTSFTDLTTAGPAVTVSLVNGQRALVTVQCRASTTGGTVGAVMGFAVTGAGSQAASDVDGCEVDGSTGANTIRQCRFTAGATGSFTFTSKYKCINPGTATFLNRRIIVDPQ